VHAEGHTEWSAYLPTGDEWQHLWSGQRFIGGQRVWVAAQLGEPPVFIRIGTAYQSLFEGLAKLL
jgi:alpha-glucosidase